MLTKEEVQELLDELHDGCFRLMRCYGAMQQLQKDNLSKDKTIASLVEEKYTMHGDGYGFLATDNEGNQVWVNSVSIAIEKLEEENAALEGKLAEKKSSENEEGK